MNTTPEVGERQQRLIVTLAMIAAAVPTVLSAQGMVSVGMDALGFPVWAAVLLATFLEIALAAFALMARQAVARGQSPSADLHATWVFSALSGVFSALHEFIGPSGTVEDITAKMLLAAAVRLSAPLVACWIWHRVLVRQAESVEGKLTRAEQRFHRGAIKVADAALEVRRGGGERAMKRLDKAFSSFRRSYLHDGRRAASMESLHELHRLTGAVDGLPALTTWSGPTLDEPTDHTAIAPEPTNIPDDSAVQAPQITPAITPTPVQPVSPASPPLPPFAHMVDEASTADESEKLTESIEKPEQTAEADPGIDAELADLVRHDLGELRDLDDSTEIRRQIAQSLLGYNPQADADELASLSEHFGVGGVHPKTYRRALDRAREAHPQLRVVNH